MMNHQMPRSAQSTHLDVCVVPQSLKETEKNPHLLDIASRSPIYSYGRSPINKSYRVVIFGDLCVGFLGWKVESI